MMNSNLGREWKVIRTIWKAFTNEREIEVYNERTIPAIPYVIHAVKLAVYIEIQGSTKVTLINENKIQL